MALERRFTREWADVYARQEREREELAGECRREELRARSDTMRVMHRAERSALAAAHSAEAKERWQAAAAARASRRSCAFPWAVVGALAFFLVVLLAR